MASLILIMTVFHANEMGSVAAKSILEVTRVFVLAWCTITLPCDTNRPRLIEISIMTRQLPVQVEARLMKNNMDIVCT